MSARPDVKGGETLEYRYYFETLNGLEYLGKAEDGRGSLLDVPKVEKSVFDNLVSRSSSHLIFGPSAEAIFTKIAFGEPTLIWTTKKGIACIEVETKILGPSRNWQGLRIKVSRRAGTAAFVAVKGADGLQPPDKENAIVIVRIPVVESDAAFSGSIDVKIEAVSKTPGVQVPASVQKPFDCTPRWKSTQLDVDDSSKNELKLSCMALAMEVSEAINGAVSPVASSREFVVEVVEVAPAPVKPAPAGGATKVALPQKKKPITVIYAHPTGRESGYLDADGVFVARIPKVAGRNVVPLQDGAKYMFTVRRPNDAKGNPLKVRGKNPGAVTGKYPK